MSYKNYKFNVLISTEEGWEHSVFMHLYAELYSNGNLQFDEDELWDIAIPYLYGQTPVSAEITTIEHGRRKYMINKYVEYS